MLCYNVNEINKNEMGVVYSTHGKIIKSVYRRDNLEGNIITDPKEIVLQCADWIVLEYRLKAAFRKHCDESLGSIEAESFLIR
jgi:hypothetical protein